MCDELIWQGFDIPTFVDNSSQITSVPVLVSTSSRSLAVLAQDDTATFTQAPDSQLPAHLPQITANRTGSSQTDREWSKPAGSPCKQPASPAPRHSKKEEQLDASTQSHVSHNGSLLVISNTDASFLQPQSTSIPGKSTMADHCHSLSASSTRSHGISHFMELSHSQGGDTTQHVAPLSHPYQSFPQTSGLRYLHCLLHQKQ